MARRTKQPKIEQPVALMRFTIVGPTVLYDRLLAACRAAYKRTGVKVQFMFEDVIPAPVPVTVVPLVTAPSVSAAQPALATAAGPGELARGRNKVVYQVANLLPATGASKQIVKAYLMRSGPCSARQVMDGTGLSQKAVESAIYGLKFVGEIRPISVALRR